LVSALTLTFLGPFPRFGQVSFTPYSLVPASPRVLFLILLKRPKQSTSYVMVCFPPARAFRFTCEPLGLSQFFSSAGSFFQGLAHCPQSCRLHFNFCGSLVPLTSPGPPVSSVTTGYSSGTPSMCDRDSLDSHLFGGLWTGHFSFFFAASPPLWTMEKFH